jgi:hypothetical protein
MEACNSSFTLRFAFLSQTHSPTFKREKYIGLVQLLPIS